MINSKKVKRFGAKLLSAVLVAGLLGGILPDLGHKENNKVEAAAPKHYAKSTFRKVIDNINELPQYVNPASFSSTEEYKEALTKSISKEWGRADRPFFILELVDYEENGEIGYLIGGCEPVPVEDMFGYNTEMSTLESQKSVTLLKGDGNTAFFLDEREGNASYYPGVSAWDTNDWFYRTDGSNPKNGAALTMYGYYENVGTDNGIFEVQFNGSKYEVVRSATGKGNIAWHTVNDIIASRPEFVGVDYDAELTASDLNSLGDRYYTKRTTDKDNPAYVVGSKYTLAENNELFLTHVMEFNEDEASKYSCAVKTITIEELNSNPEWVEYADLIYMSYRGKNGAAPAIWKTRNRLNHMSKVGVGGTYEDNYFLTHDLDWTVCQKIFDKVTATTNYAALVYDNNIYDASFKESADTVTMYDSNFNKLNWVKKDVPATNNNIMKMCMLTVGVNPNLVKRVFMKYINVVDDGHGKKIPIYTKQDGNAKQNWTNYTFLLLPEGMDLINGSDSHLESYVASKEYWLSFEGTVNYTQENFKAYAFNRVYTYKGNNNMASGFVTDHVGVKHDFFEDFDEYMKDHYGDPSRASENGSPADAIRYALGLHKTVVPFDGDLNVLDIEPSVDLDSGHKPIWTLKESSIYFMLPSFSGDVNITHMTTMEFVGKVTNLNSDYDMIYFGTDIGGFNTKEVSGETRTDFNDDNLDGKIYFHTGDIARYNNGYTKQEEYGDVNYVANSGASNNGSMRFSGNDISSLKKAELENYLKGEHPIVFSGKIYDTSTMDTYLDTESNCQIRNLIKDTTYRDKVTFSDRNTYGLDDLVMNGRAGVSFLQLPTTYLADAAHITNYVINEDAGYLSGSLTFKFKVPNGNFRYKIYIDKNRDGKFLDADNELVVDRAASPGQNYFSYALSSSMMGFIQWKIIVYDTTRPGVEKVETGCSAARMKAGAEKKVIKVLQIMPNNSNLNLQNNQKFIKYTEKLKEFQVIIHSITRTEFENTLQKVKNSVGRKFTYDIGRGIVEGEGVPNPNPATDLVTALESAKPRIIVGGHEQDSPYGLLQYNMLVIGFADMYGKEDLGNSNGAAEFLYYFGSREDRSILYTHDTTSMFSTINPDGTGKGYGTTPNTLLRDQMGMNRFAMISKYLDYLRPGLKNEMITYQSSRIYDTISSKTNEYHGMSSFCIHKLGKGEDTYQMPYKYMLKVNGTTGFGPANYETTKAAMLNAGQITSYPYYINPEFTVATTHPQYFQLNVEDPNMTVWYCLADNGSSYGIGASPMDAVNNYYIYSKGNIFYSGVGHSSINGDEEVKLFVNTMIAAYRQDTSAPYAEVVNDDVIQNDEHVYTLQVLRENNSDTLLEDLSGSTETVRVYFQILDGNFSNNLSCKITFDGMPADLKVRRKENNTEFTKDAEGFFTGIQHGELCYFDYPVKLLNGGAKDVTFECHNNIRKTSIGTSTLHMTLQPLFFLD